MLVLDNLQVNMATFTINVQKEKIPGTDFLEPISTVTTSCATIYEIEINATPGDDISFVLTNGGYSNYTTELNTGSGFTLVSNTSFSFTYPVSFTPVLKVSLFNTNVVEGLEVIVIGDNNTDIETEQFVCIRTSTGIIC